MAVAFDADTTTGTSATAVPPFNISNMTVGSGANRALILLLNCGDSNTGFPAGLAVSWDSAGTPQTMTQITNALIAGAAGGTTALFGLLAPTSGNKNCAVTWTTGSHEMHGMMIAFTGVNQTSIATAFPNGGSASGSTNPASITVTTANGNAVVAFFAQSTGVWQSTNNNTIALDNTGANVGVAGNYVLSTSGSASMTATIGSATPFDAVGTDVLAFAAAGASSSTLPLLGVA